MWSWRCYWLTSSAAASGRERRLSIWLRETRCQRPEREKAVRSSPFVLPLAWMAKLFAKHADWGGLHLETRCIKGEWEWWVLNRKDRTEVGRGKSTSLGDAMPLLLKSSPGENPCVHSFRTGSDGRKKKRSLRLDARSAAELVGSDLSRKALLPPAVCFHFRKSFVRYFFRLIR